MAQRHVATQKWREQPYLHWGDGPALGPELEEAPQPLTAPWLAGVLLEFSPEEDDFVVTEGEKRIRRLDIGQGTLRSLRSKTTIRGMLGNDKLFLSTHSCAYRLVKSRPDRVTSAPKSYPFVRAAARDWQRCDVEDALSTFDSISASIRENPWVAVSQSLDRMIDWAEFEDGILTTAAQCLMD